MVEPAAVNHLRRPVQCQRTSVSGAAGNARSAAAQHRPRSRTVRRIVAQQYSVRRESYQWPPCHTGRATRAVTEDGWVDGVEFNAPLDTIQVISEAVFTANHLTDTDKQNSTGKYRQTDSIQIRKSRQPKIQQNKTTLVQLPLTTLGQETRWAYSTTLPRPEPTWGGSGRGPTSTKGGGRTSLLLPRSPRTVVTPLRQSGSSQCHHHRRVGTGTCLSYSRVRDSALSITNKR